MLAAENLEPSELVTVFSDFISLKCSWPKLMVSIEVFL